MMNSIHIIGVGTLLMSTLSAHVGAEETGRGQQSRLGVGQVQKSVERCEVLQWNREKFDRPVMGIFRPGKYCLDQNYEYDCPLFNHGCAGKMIEIRASNVDLDLRGHTLRMSGTRGYIGVWGLGQNIRVHNGRIKGAGLGITLMNRSSSPADAYPVFPVNTKAVFSETGFVVEHMRFDDVLTAIEAAGSGNRIRDNVIDAGLDAKAAGSPPFAVLSYGPSARIERNTFRLHDLTPGSNGYAIYLRSADGTVVDGNTVRVDDDRAGTIGVGLSNSKGVSLGRNRIDTERAVEMDASSSLDSTAPNGPGPGRR